MFLNLPLSYNSTLYVIKCFFTLLSQVVQKLYMRIKTISGTLFRDNKVHSLKNVTSFLNKRTATNSARTGFKTDKNLISVPMQPHLKSSTLILSFLSLPHYEKDTHNFDFDSNMQLDCRRMAHKTDMVPSK